MGRRRKAIWPQPLSTQNKKAPRCYLSSHHLAEILQESAVSHMCNHLLSQKERKQSRILKPEQPKWQLSHSLSSLGPSVHTGSLLWVTLCISLWQAHLVFSSKVDNAASSETPKLEQGPRKRWPDLVGDLVQDFVCVCVSTTCQPQPTSPPACTPWGRQQITI